jgi:hypothetical protein
MNKAKSDPWKKCVLNLIKFMINEIKDHSDLNKAVHYANVMNALVRFMPKASAKAKKKGKK